MRYRWIGWTFWLIAAAAATAQTDSAQIFPAGQDLHLTAPLMIIPQTPPQPDVSRLILENGVSVTIGDNQITADSAVAVLTYIGEQTDLFEGQYYQARLYLEGAVSLTRGSKARTTDFSKEIVRNAHVLTVRFLVTGQVFVTADTQTKVSWTDFQNQPPYTRALQAFDQMRPGPAIAPSAYVPSVEDRFKKPSKEPGGEAGFFARNEPPAVAAPAKSEPSYFYPIHINALWEPAPEVEKMTRPDGTSVATISGRFYLWQKRDESGTLLEFLADSAVVYYSGGDFSTSGPNAAGNEIAAGKIESVYLAGNIVMTEGDITIRADQIYYDFPRHQALIVNAEMQTYSESRSLPIYIRAEKLRQVSETTFEGENVQLTDSEFYLPQISVYAARMVLLTPQQLEARTEQIETTGNKPSREQYLGTFEDVSFRYGTHSLWNWSELQTNFQRPDLPISRLRIGNDNEFGTTVETRWNLAKILGRSQPEGVDSDLLLDYFSDRGVGGGIEAEYNLPDSLGYLLGYVMSYRGKDDLGSERDNLDPKRDTRGRFSWRHRSYLPDDWQLTLEVGYLSDRYFQEWMYRGEFYTDKAQETLIYLKRLKDNWAFSVLGKVRINNFENTIEELPTVEYHLKGASFWDNRFTFYSDTQVGRLRNRFDNDIMTPPTTEDFYTLAFTRNEVDLPLTWNTLKIVPFAAATYAFDDHDEFNQNLDGTTIPPEDQLVLGEYGVRMSTMFWKQDPSVRSRLWDLNGIRHLVTPHFEAVFYEENDPTIEMRNMYNVGVSQRWQTHRGPGENQHTVDFLRWDVDTTWMDNPADSSIDPLGRYGPAGFLFNNPSIPLRDRRNGPFFGLVRNSINSDVEWKVSDTMAVLGGVNYDLHSGHVQQLDVGISRYIHPDLSYYIGKRYLRPVIVDVPAEGIYEQGSNSLITAITYALSQRYTATFAMEYNFDYEKTVRSELSIIRQYHRLFYGVNVSLDESLGRQAVSLSIWPQGIKELAIGRRYMGMTQPIREE